MAEWAARLKVGAAAETKLIPYNAVMGEMDVNNSDFGVQRFVFKQVFDAGVAASAGSPVGTTQAAGGGIVTPDQSDVTAIAIRGMNGGICTFAVAANAIRYGWIQFEGVNRYGALAGSGTITAGVGTVWSGDDTLTDVGATDEEAIFAVPQVTKNSSNVIVAGNLLLLG